MYTTDMPDSGLGIRVKVFATFYLVPSSLGSLKEKSFHLELSGCEVYYTA